MRIWPKWNYFSLKLSFFMNIVCCIPFSTDINCQLIYFMRNTFMNRRCGNYLLHTVQMYKLLYHSFIHKFDFLSGKAVIKFPLTENLYSNVRYLYRIRIVFSATVRYLQKCFPIIKLWIRLRTEFLWQKHWGLFPSI